MGRNPSSHYLIKVTSLYHFRIVIPPDLRSIFALREIRYPLKTGHLTRAKYRAMQMASCVHRLFLNLKLNQGAAMKTLTEQEIKLLLDKYYRKILEEDEMSRVMESEPIPDDVHQEEKMGYACIQESLKKDLTSAKVRALRQESGGSRAEAGPSMPMFIGRVL